jgi:hypothetical protein
MAKTKISEFDSNPANNTDIDSINIAEGCAPSGINNAIRELMSQLKDQQTGASSDNFTVGGNLVVNGTSIHTGATTFTGAVVMSTALPVTSGGTGASTAANARTNLAIASSGANSDITSITGLTTPLSVAQGGIGAATLTANRVLLGNGTSTPQLIAPSTSGNVLTSNGTTWTSAAPSGIGIGQTWQDLTSSRVFGTTYTNNTGYPIMVAIAATVLNTATWTVMVAGLQIIQMSGSGASANADVTGTFIVPNGATYIANGSGSSLSRWSELR